jgi:PilZ domain
MSIGGAKLIVKDPQALPDCFKLFFSPTANTFRDCIVRWRKSDSIGVQFVNVVVGVAKRL